MSPGYRLQENRWGDLYCVNVLLDAKLPPVPCLVKKSLARWGLGL